jgi:hypothetical protein
MQFLNEDGAVFNSTFLYTADPDNISPHTPKTSSLGGHVTRSYTPATPDPSVHINRFAAARTLSSSSSKSKDSLPELASTLSRRRTPHQFEPILNDLPVPVEGSRGASLHTYEADPIFTATAPGISSSIRGTMSNRDHQEQQQVLRRTRQEL